MADAPTKAAESTAETPVDILIVDDQPAELLAIEAVLAEPGINLVRATSGREALRRLLEHDFALVLLDVLMPDIDGFETAQFIRKRERTAHTPIIFLTGLSGGELPRFRAYAVGAVDYVVKPFEPEVLRSKVMVFVDLARTAVRMRAQEVRLREMESRRWLEGLLDVLPIPVVLEAAPSGEVAFQNRAAGRLAPEVLTEARGRDDGAAGHLIEHESTAFLVNTELLPPQGERPPMRMLSFVDVSELRHTERELRKALRVRDDFVSIASHELKTPLASIDLLVNGAMRQLRRVTAGEVSPDVVKDKLERAETAVRRLSTLVEHLLDVTRIEARGLDLAPEEMDLSELATEVAGRFSDLARQAKCTLTVQAPAPVVGHWDRGRLDQVVTNLLGNAIKYAPDGPIILSVAKTDEHAIVTVTDAGKGVPPQDRERIFERFESATTSSGHKRGFGLGLWIVRIIAEAHGGSVRVESAPGTGASFVLALPLGARPSTNHRPPSPQAAPPT